MCLNQLLQHKFSLCFIPKGGRTVLLELLSISRVDTVDRRQAGHVCSSFRQKVGDFYNNLNPERVFRGTYV